MLLSSIAQDIQGFFEAGIFIDIKQNDGCRTSVLRDDDFLLALLYPRHEFRRRALISDNDNVFVIVDFVCERPEFWSLEYCDRRGAIK